MRRSGGGATGLCVPVGVGGGRAVVDHARWITLPSNGLSRAASPRASTSIPRARAARPGASGQRLPAVVSLELETVPESIARSVCSAGSCNGVDALLSMSVRQPISPLRCASHGGRSCRFATRGGRRLCPIMGRYRRNLWYRFRNTSLDMAPTRYTPHLVLGPERATRHVAGCPWVPGSLPRFDRSAMPPERRLPALAWCCPPAFARPLQLRSAERLPPGE